MEKIVTKKRKSALWLVLVLFILLIVIFYYYNKYLKTLTYDNVYKNISEIGRQNTTNLNITIDNQKKFVEQVVSTINTGTFKSIEEIFSNFKDDLNAYHFTRFAILNKEGNGITSDNIKIKDYPNIEEFFNSDSVYLSENRPSTVSDYQVNIYSKTFHFNNEELVFFATINTEQYVSILSRYIFNGAGGTLLINQYGDVLIDSTMLLNIGNTNLFDFLLNNYKTLTKDELTQIEKMKNDILNKKSGNIKIRFNNTRYFFSYEILGINNWYVITTVPSSVIAKEINLFLLISFGISILFIFVITSIFIYISITNEKSRQKLYNIAYIDKITDLGNELYFKEEGTKLLKNTLEEKYIIALDVNKFKALNNIYGYEFCNKILKLIGEKLKAILPNESVVCRVSNDKFVGIFYYKKNIEKLLNKIFNDISNIEINNIIIKVNLSIGVYKISVKDNDINKIMDKAYMAHAKIKGIYDKNYYIFDEELENKLLEEQQIESSMEEALKNDEFKVFYQPKIYTSTEKIYGAEALVRWDKDSKMIPPGKFIPLFEKNKFITKLDIYMFKKVCKDMASWKEKYNYVPTISINVSKEHFTYENFIDEYVKIADKYNIDKGKIDIEVTESATIDEKIDTLKVMNNIKSKGFIVSIDDFGTGYSSLSMLQNMPIDIIKIDKIFVDKANLNTNNNIINYIVSIAKHLKIKTIVEGIETKEQVEFMKKINVDIIQGYYYSKPISKEEFEVYFKRKNKL